MLNLARRLAANTPPGAFGGGETEFSPQEIGYLCSIQRSMPGTATNGFIRTVANYLAAVMGRPVDVIIDALTDMTLCSEISASLLPATVQATAVSTVIPTDKNGYPVSTNKTWNACFKAINGTYVLVKGDIQSNPDKDKDGTPRDCAYYNPNNAGVWNYPFYNGKIWMTQFSFVYDKSSDTYTLPANHVLQAQEKVATK